MKPELKTIVQRLSLGMYALAIYDRNGKLLKLALIPNYAAIK